MERPIADNSDRPKCGRQNQDVYWNEFERYMERPIADSSDRPIEGGQVQTIVNHCRHCMT